jgi:hypothetical protein
MSSDTNAISMTSEELARLERTHKLPHVVILGAGASLAAFPNGDRAGRRLPLMQNLAEIVGLEDMLRDAGLGTAGNFESLYSELHRKDSTSPVLRQIETRVEDYFGKLELPDCVTLYDLLLLSLRPKDAIFTFNWDPFLADAYRRHVEYAKLPHIFHLHGNVRVSFCPACGVAMARRDHCLTCRGELMHSRLLYPVEQKNYADDPLIATQWKAARKFVREAFIITIFGYSAPTTDQEAIGIITEAWKGLEWDRLADRVEVIDVKDREELAEQWHDFPYYGHYDIRRSFHESLLARYPRRTCEAWYYIGIEGKFTHFMPWVTNLEGLRTRVEELQEYERCNTSRLEMQCWGR